MSTSIRKNLAAWLFVALVVALTPLLLRSYSSNPPLVRTGAPGENTCGSCHGGSTGAVITITPTNGTSYTPGVAKALTVTVGGGPNVVWGYEMTAVQASANTTGAGTFASTDGNSSVRQGTGTNSTKSYAAQTNDAVSTYALNWTPPASSVGNVTLYASGVSGDGSGDESGDAAAITSLTLTPATAANLTLSPTTLSYAYQIGGTTPAAQSVSVTSTGSALNFTVTTNQSWLAATPASGTTPGTLSVAVNPAGLTAGTYTGTVSVAATGAGNSPQTVAVTLVVTSAPNITLSPTSLSYAYQIGGTTPAAQSVSVTSTGSGLNFTVTTNQSWLAATPASGTTPGTLSVAVNPMGLTAGTYTGTVSVAATGAGNSPQTVAVTLTVTSATPNLTLSPTTLSYTYQIGGTTPAAQSVSVTSTGSALNFAVTTNQSWLTATPASGTTPGTLSVAVNPTGLTAGTYTGTVSVAATGAGNSPQTVAVTLTVSNAGSGSLVAKPTTLSFNSGRDSEDGQLSKYMRVISTGAPLQFTAEALGGSWLSVSPSAGTTPARLKVTVFTDGLHRGRYTGQIHLTAPGASSLDVPIILVVVGSHDGADSISAATYTFDPAETGAVASTWVYGAGVPGDVTDPTNQGLVLTNNASASSQARAGVILSTVEGLTLSELGFDLRQGSLCSAHGPRFAVVTNDGVEHTIGGCNAASAQSAPAQGWKRFRFDPAQASPAIAPSSTVKSIALTLDDGPDAGGGMVVLDNINVNGTFVGRE